ncbi:MAG: peptidoglycan-associated lipoprotein Pal [Nitrospiraceae bacterium]|nr:MAG: peptidoglycan-associated lipoprotein Pal [Nitrospiraceae bacterium]
MKKFLIVLLLVFVVGCAKKLPPPAETTMPKEPVRKEAAAEQAKEQVKETLAQKEAKLQEGVLPTTAGEPSIFRDVLFDYDKYTIRDDSRPVLNEIAAYLKKNNVSIIIEGHCDERGTNEYNLALGEKRAKAAKDYLASLGVPPSKMSTVTYGEEKPACTEQSESCWQKNRRAHFTISGQ